MSCRVSQIAYCGRLSSFGFSGFSLCGSGFAGAALGSASLLRFCFLGPGGRLGAGPGFGLRVLRRGSWPRSRLRTRRRIYVRRRRPVGTSRLSSRRRFIRPGRWSCVGTRRLTSGRRLIWPGRRSCIGTNRFIPRSRFIRTGCRGRVGTRRLTSRRRFIRPWCRGRVGTTRCRNGIRTRLGLSWPIRHRSWLDAARAWLRRGWLRLRMHSPAARGARRDPPEGVD